MVVDLWRDVRLALRGLRKAPMFTFVAVLTLAVGIGANTAVFSVLRALVLAPLPYPHLDRLVVIPKELVKRGIPDYPAAAGELVRYRGAPGLAEVAGVTAGSAVITDGGEPERVRAASVFWTRRFGADSSVIGRQIHFNYGARGLAVVGVLPKGFRFVTSSVSGIGTDHPDVWAPLRIDPAGPYGGSTPRRSRSYRSGGSRHRPRRASADAWSSDAAS